MNKIATRISSIAAIAILCGAALPALAQESGANARTRAEAIQARIASTTALRMTKEQDQANKEIDNRLTSLQNFDTRIASMRISSTTKDTLGSEVQAQIQELSDLKGKIGTDASTTLKTDLQSITKSFRTYALLEPRVNIMAATSRITGLVQAMQTVGTKLQTLITNASTSGANVTAAEAALADYQTKVADAQTQAQAAQSEVSGLQPDNGDKTILQSNLAALKDARSKIVAAQHDLNAARKDIDTIRKSLPKPAREATTTQETATTSTQ